MASAYGSRHLKRATIALIAAGSLGAGLVGCGKSAPPPSAPPPVEVTAVTVQPRTVPITLQYLAQIKSSHQVDIMARVDGNLEKIRYQEGNLVRQGDVLFELDKKQYQAEAEDARAEVEIRRSDLASAKAKLDRTVPLFKENAASRKALDDATIELKKSESALQQAQAKYDKALLKVSYCTITAPVNGVAGQAFIREGGYVASGGPSARLTTVSKLDPAWVEFSISQNQQDRLHQEVLDGRLLLPREGRYTVELELAGGVRYPHTGTLSFINPAYDKNASYLVRAEIPNPIPSKYMLIPGMFVKVSLKGAQRPNALLLPQRAVRQGTKGHEIYVVNEKGLAELRPVTTGDWVGQEWIISQGLKPGERVIVDDGIMKIFPGAPVKAVPVAEGRAPAVQLPAAAK